MSKIAIFFKNPNPVNPVYDFSKAKDDKEKAELAKSFVRRLLFGMSLGNAIDAEAIFNRIYDAAAIADSEDGVVLDVTKILSFLAEEFIPALNEQIVIVGTQFVNVQIVNDQPVLRFLSTDEMEAL